MTAETFMSIAGVLVTVAIALLTLSDNRQRDASRRLHQRLDEAVEKGQANGSRITAIETEIKHIPSAESIGQLYEKINSVKETAARIEGGQAVLTNLLTRSLEVREDELRPRHTRSRKP